MPPYYYFQADSYEYYCANTIDSIAKVHPYVTSHSVDLFSLVVLHIHNTSLLPQTLIDLLLSTLWSVTGD